ncbi:hypothetical protein KP509_21G076600 [Ceratopteris richardii]|uniref:XS domain-containing protein n=1 Tax=Ceratopteris richardii TaxID=49495 RepID=A0A8T2SEJ0_CERRI|nr:hypothetical protein KP509_21G076600 [Ceratopteris richardii]KAH7316054.1 hypothetical protein KP509_21G076600 [Ceratopteris richardii]
MTGRDIGSGERNSHRDGRHDAGRSVRYPLHPPSVHRDRTRGSSPLRSRRVHSISPLKAHGDRLRRDSGRRGDHKDPSPRRRHSRSPVRSSRHGSDARNFRGRSSDRYKRRSLEPPPRRSFSRERRVRSPPRFSGRSPPPRLTMRTPPHPTTRSPHMPMRPLSPRYQMRPSPPRARALLASPRASLRGVSPRLALRPHSPQVSMRSRSPHGTVRQPRLTPPLSSAFEREHERHAHDAILASRSGPMLGLQNAASLGAVASDVLSKQEDETLSGSGMLVSRSIVMNDGTVGTFYALPPDPVVNPLQTTMDSALGSQVLPTLPDGVSQYNAEPAGLRYGGLDKYVSIERDFLAPQDQRLPDRAMSSQNQFAAGERSLPDYPSYPRDQPQSPYQNVFDHSVRRRASRSPLRDGDGVVSLPNRETYVSEIERASRRMNYDKRDPVYPIEPPFGGGFRSPHGQHLDQDFTKILDKDVIGYGRGERNGEIWRVPDGGRMASHRYPPVYDLTRQQGLARSPEPRQGSRFEPRNASFQRHIRTPPREFPRREEFLRDHVDFRPPLRRHPSPEKHGRMTPRSLRSLTPEKMRKNSSYEEERRAWKRKFIEMGGEPPLEHRVSAPFEPAYKRRVLNVHNGDMHSDFMRDRRHSGWDSRERWSDRREGRFVRPDRRPMGDRSNSPGFHKRHPDADRRYLERTNAEQMEDKDKQEPLTDLPEDSAEFKQQVQRSLLKYAKLINEDAEQRKKYEEQGKAGTLLCLACGRSSKPFVDTHSLIMHTFQSQKKGLRADHLGLCKAICSIMGWSHNIDPAGGKSYQDCSPEEAKSNKEDLILWPPAVIVHSTSKKGEEQQITLDSSFRELLKEKGFLSERVKIASGRGGTVIVKYSPLLPCLHDAERLHQYFMLSNLGRDAWAHMESFKEDVNGEADSSPEQKNMFYGYLALAQDLDKVDLDSVRRCQIKSRKDIEAIIGDPVAAKVED